jgi:hypothetical protein
MHASTAAVRLDIDGHEACPDLTPRGPSSELGIESRCRNGRRMALRGREKTRVHNFFLTYDSRDYEANVKVDICTVGSFTLPIFAFCCGSGTDAPAMAGAKTLIASSLTLESADPCNVKASRLQPFLERPSIQCATI